jgi:DNA-binding GntR family transcriptional regulator
MLMNKQVDGRGKSSNSVLPGRDQLGESAYERIREAIRSGDLEPGHRITESDLAKWLNMSRTPVREAVSRLETEGLLTYVPRQGLTVAQLDYQAVMELYEMREVLEGTAARFAAHHAALAEIETLREMLDLEADLGESDPKRGAKANRHFHQIIYHAAHNRYLLKTLNALSDSMMLLGDTTLALPGRHATALEEHRAIVDAISARDADRAQQAACNHIRAAQRHRLKLLLAGTETAGAKSSAQASDSVGD